MALEFDTTLYEALLEAVEDKNEVFIRSALETLHATDISNILDEMDSQQAKFVMQLLDAEVSAEILSNLDEYIREKFLKHIDPAAVASWVEHMESDDAADMLLSLSDDKCSEVISLIKDSEKADNILDLLNYEEDTAGGLMAKELIKVNLNFNVVECIEEIRRQAEKVEHVYGVYVVDDDNVLKGRVPLKNLIISDRNSKVADIYDDEIIYIKTYRSQREVIELMQKYDLEAIPVVNARKQLVGRITIDDVVDVMQEQSELEKQMMSGIVEEVDETDSIWTLSRARLPWLIIGMAGGLLGAQFIGFFKQDLILIPAMAFFIPLITATGGNVGIQSSSIILQSLSHQSTFRINYLQRLFKTCMVAIINGLVISGFVFIFTAFLDNNLHLAVVVSISLFSVVLLASIMGTITPIILDRIGINPALASGPFITTANDLLGLGVYFGTSRVLYQFFL